MPRKRNVIEMPFFLSEKELPEPHETVIVAGGMAVHDGTKWLSAVHDGCGQMRAIDWPVKWWTPIIFTDEHKQLPQD